MPQGGQKQHKYRLPDEEQDVIDAFLIRCGFFKGDLESPTRMEISLLLKAIAKHESIREALFRLLDLAGEIKPPKKKT